MMLAGWFVHSYDVREIHAFFNHDQCKSVEWKEYDFEESVFLP